MFTEILQKVGTSLVCCLFCVTLRICVCTDVVLKCRAWLGTVVAHACNHSHWRLRQEDHKPGQLGETPSQNGESAGCHSVVERPWVQALVLG